MLLIGPFSQIITLRHLPLKGAVADAALEIIENGGVVTDGATIVAVGSVEELRQQYPKCAVQWMETPMVLLPGFIDSHTHICFGGTRSTDYALRNGGSTYLDIAKAGGGIWSSVQATRAATEQQLLQSLLQRIQRHLQEGITTMEVKSGYGLNGEAELKMLRVIQQAQALTPATLVPTCLAAHIRPKDFGGTHPQYLQWIVAELLPVVTKEQLARRVDIFIEETAFTRQDAIPFLQHARQQGFITTVHADQFSAGSSKIAVQCGAASADHLEASTEEEITALAASQTVATVLPGASLGLGLPFAPARRLLNAGCCLAIASDWNPGSAPQGDLLMQAAVLGAYEKLTAAEVFAGLTYRAARALKLENTGRIEAGFAADLQAYPTADYREILYHQGRLKASRVWKGGATIGGDEKLTPL